LGTLVDERYRLDRLIGEGASAWVFAGHDARLDRFVAVKLLKPDENSRQAETQRRFLSEGRTLAKLVHPNVVPVYDAGVTGEGFSFLVMELCEAGTLEAELFRREVLGAEETVELLFPLLGALACAHDRRIVHRDIKPANIVLAAENGERCAKLLDFGIAKRSDSRSTDSASGTPSYMAPEQATGRRPSAAVDVWSMGVVFYRCLSGGLPFSGETHLVALQKLVSERAPRFAKACPALGKHLAIALDRALERDPQRRYRDMRSFAQALAVACAQDGIALVSRREPPGLAGVDLRGGETHVEITRPLGELARAAAAAGRPRAAYSKRESTVVIAVVLAMISLGVMLATSLTQRTIPASPVAHAQARARAVAPVPRAAIKSVRQEQIDQGERVPSPAVVPPLAFPLSGAKSRSGKRRKASSQPPSIATTSRPEAAPAEPVRSATPQSGLVRNWEW
jgi:serine/threonine-protein kinase